ncbi:MAG: hypothetical protein E6314_00230 [Enterobacter sp.]|nr:hypothetical protein [Enterobacter sp.]MDU7181379.1 hypothetical protein [Enterobacter roggenkampii]
MTSREKFEQAIKSRFGDLIDYRVCKNSDGEYMAWDMQVAWWAWQAAETDLAVQLANAESKCRELAAEVQAVRWACGQVYMKGYNHGHLNTVDGLEYASDTELVERGGETLADFTDPDHCGIAADAILDEVRASGVEMVIAYHRERADALHHVDRSNAIRHSMAAIDASDVAAQLRKGAAL